MLARAQPTKNDGSHRRTNPEPRSSRDPLQPVAGRRSPSDRSASLRRAGAGCARMQTTSGVPIGRTDIGHDQMRSKSQAAWETAARCATLAQEADDPQEQEHYARLRDAWI